MVKKFPGVLGTSVERRRKLKQLFPEASLRDYKWILERPIWRVAKVWRYILGHSGLSPMFLWNFFGVSQGRFWEQIKKEGWAVSMVRCGGTGLPILRGNIMSPGVPATIPFNPEIWKKAFTNTRYGKDPTYGEIGESLKQHLSSGRELRTWHLPNRGGAMNEEDMLLLEEARDLALHD